MAARSKAKIFEPIFSHKSSAAEMEIMQTLSQNKNLMKSLDIISYFHFEFHARKMKAVVVLLTTVLWYLMELVA